MELLASEPTSHGGEIGNDDTKLAGDEISNVGR